MQCEICGSNQIKKENENTFVCQECGMQYDIQTVRNLLKDDNESAFTSNNKNPTIEDLNDILNNPVSFTDVPRETVLSKEDLFLGIIDRKYKDEIAKWARSGDRSWKIKAIGLYREATGFGLAEAKDAIDRYYAELVK